MELNGAITYGITSENIHLPISKEKVIKELRKRGYKGIKIEPATVKFTDLCPQCNRPGIPKIERKDTKDNRLWTLKNKERSDEPKRRPNEYWLTYDHKTKPKKCRVQQLVYATRPQFKKNTRKNIDIKKSLFPYAWESMGS